MSYNVTRLSESSGLDFVQIFVIQIPDIIKYALGICLCILDELFKQ